MTLFRREAIERQTHRLEGDVFVGVPAAWQSIGFLLGAALVAAVAFLTFADYARVANATGLIVPDKGVAVVTPPRPGTIGDMAVADGDAVEEGDILMTVRAEEFLESGEGATAQILDLLRRQTVSVDAQIEALRSEMDLQVRQYDGQIAGLGQEIITVDQQLELQRTRIASATAEIERIRPLVVKGLVSGRDLAEREEALIERRQQLAQLEQTLAGRRSAREDAVRMKQRVAAQGAERIAGFKASRAQVDRSLSDAERARAFVLRAPVAGTVSNLTARVGMAVSLDVPILSILPRGATLRAELSVPANAIGFVAPGQDVRLSVDTFPYEQFGTIAAKVLEVAQTSIAGEDGRRYYRVVADLDRTAITAYGRDQPLVSGMTITARIVTARQSLIEWLFEPLYALARR